jgi:hypothetical protein
MPEGLFTTGSTKMAHTKNWCRKDKRLAIYLRDGLKCVYCQATLEDAPLSLDHLVPRSDGGSNESGNLVTCCCECNRRRGVTPLTIWLAHTQTDPAATARFIVEHTALDLRPYRAEAKVIIARRQQEKDNA